MRHAILILCLLLGSLSGCSDKTPNNADTFGGEDGKKIAALIGDFEDDCQKPAEFAKMATPALAKSFERKKFLGYSFQLVDKPNVTGATATAVVKYTSVRTANKMVEKTWSFVKEGDTWKLSEAPAP
jgi:hypothetical protein